ncbi:MAG: hypothetical protein GF311_17060 [Candidatus Lokiarchaeota archaeon]|nr:hypothetical protein [Candidatus Lokiarchaeota archaeon]
MPRGRKARTAPEVAADPLDEYSMWDKRIARVFLYSTIIAAIFIASGMWALIIERLIISGLWFEIIAWNILLQIALWTGIITGHLIIIVLFYTLFRGGTLKICRAIFKDRKVAKKYEDFDTLRWIIGVAVLGGLITIFFLLVGLVPPFLGLIGDFFIFMFAHFEIWRWLLDLGIFILIILGIFFAILYFWNHGVYYVVKNIKQIEEEIEVDERIKEEQLKNADEKTLRKVYKKDTGKKAIYKGKETKGYLEWKKKHGLK